MQTLHGSRSARLVLIFGLKTLRPPYRNCPALRHARRVVRVLASYSMGENHEIHDIQKNAQCIYSKQCVFTLKTACSYVGAYKSP